MVETDPTLKFGFTVQMQDLFKKAVKQRNIAQDDTKDLSERNRAYTELTTIHESMVLLVQEMEDAASDYNKKKKKSKVT